MSGGAMSGSFFPTANEMSVGLKWLKDHPVMATAAAAAATAVSVVSYLRASEKEDQMQHVVSWCDEHGGELSKIVGEEDLRSPTSAVSTSSSSLTEELARFTLDDDRKLTSHEQESIDNFLPIENEQYIQSASPQWGWYVAITPPRDTLNVPRAITQPAMTSPSKCSSLKRTQSVKLRTHQ